MIVCDTDIISAFAKAGALEELLSLFKGKVCIVPSVSDELKASLMYGHVYPQEIFAKVRQIELSLEEQDLHKTFLNLNLNLGEGELESIAVCAKRNWAFSSFDKNAIKFSEENGVKLVLGSSILRSLWILKVCSVDRVKEIVKLIEEKDKRTLDIEGVFD